MQLNAMVPATITMATTLLSAIWTVNLALNNPLCPVHADNIAFGVAGAAYQVRL
jgi:hypothetical protein